MPLPFHPLSLGERARVRERRWRRISAEPTRFFPAAKPRSIRPENPRRHHTYESLLLHDGSYNVTGTTQSEGAARENRCLFRMACNSPCDRSEDRRRRMEIGMSPFSTIFYVNGECRGTASITDANAGAIIYTKITTCLKTFMTTVTTALKKAAGMKVKAGKRATVKVRGKERFSVD